MSARHRDSVLCSSVGQELSIRWVGGGGGGGVATGNNVVLPRAIIRSKA